MTYKDKKFSGNELKGKDYQDDIFIDCRFLGANLTQAVFEKCKLKETDFTGADINGINIENSHIEKTILDLNGFIQFGNSKGFVLQEQISDKVT